MEIKKINLDRKPLDTEYIRSKQDFQQVIGSYKKNQIPVFKRPLFYGAVGFASLATLITVSLFNFNTNENGNIITSKVEEKIETAPELHSIKKHVISTINPVSISQVTSASTVETKSRHTKNELNKTGKLVAEEGSALNTSAIKSEKRFTSSLSNIPQISGISDGAISVSELCSSEGIQLKNGNEVVSFKFQYISGGTDKVITVEGNKIPTAVCTEMAKNNIEQMVFITDIVAMNENSKVQVPSMNLWVTKKG